ncbi:unnamed protein product [Larinioides sclopetarius]|uniref:Uncharacterized protein n=1 Tax=Larinioides sclopetarius TaxID=280406 RepID=A0AAV2BVB4_9ARAC
MNTSSNEFEEALAFAEDLVWTFFISSNVSLSPSSGASYRIRSHVNFDVLLTVYHFSRVLSKPYYRANYFPRGYNVLDFLLFCGKVVSQALHDYRCGTEEAVEYAINSIATCLNEFMSSGEFERNGGWSELQDTCSKLSTWPAFRSVVCLGNKYGDRAEC